MASVILSVPSPLKVRVADAALIMGAGSSAKVLLPVMLFVPVKLIVTHEFLPIEITGVSPPAFSQRAESSMVIESRLRVTSVKPLSILIQVFSLEPERS